MYRYFKHSRLNRPIIKVNVPISKEKWYKLKLVDSLMLIIAGFTGYIAFETWHVADHTDKVATHADEFGSSAKNQITEMSHLEEAVNNLTAILKSSQKQFETEKKLADLEEHSALMGERHDSIRLLDQIKGLTAKVRTTAEALRALAPDSLMNWPP